MNYQQAMRILTGELGLDAAELADALEISRARVPGTLEPDDDSSREPSPPPRDWRDRLGTYLRVRAREVMEGDPEAGIGPDGSLPAYDSANSLSGSEEAAQRLYSVARQIEWGDRIPYDR